jgi:hypothetical protein
VSIAAGEAAAGRLAAPLRGLAGRGRRLAWHRPEWWALGLAAAAWALLLAANLRTAVAAGSHAHGHAAGGAGTALVAATAHWQLMVVAMMLPVVVPSLRFVAFRSYWRRRHRAVTGFLAGYLGVWALAGVAVSLPLAAAPGLAGRWPAAAVAGAFLLAAGWQWTRVKRRALVTCHRTAPLAPGGWRADRDCVLFGWRIGGSCCLSCWPLMLACTLAGHSTPALLVCGWIGWVERSSWRPNTRLLSAVIAALAVVFAWLQRS